MSSNISSNKSFTDFLNLKLIIFIFVILAPITMSTYVVNEETLILMATLAFFYFAHVSVSPMIRSSYLEKRSNINTTFKALQLNVILNKKVWLELHKKEFLYFKTLIPTTFLKHIYLYTVLYKNSLFVNNGYAHDNIITVLDWISREEFSSKNNKVQAYSDAISRSVVQRCNGSVLFNNGYWASISKIKNKNKYIGLTYGMNSVLEYFYKKSVVGLSSKKQLNLVTANNNLLPLYVKLLYRHNNLDRLNNLNYFNKLLNNLNDLSNWNEFIYNKWYKHLNVNTLRLKKDSLNITNFLFYLGKKTTLNSKNKWLLFSILCSNIEVKN